MGSFILALLCSLAGHTLALTALTDGNLKTAAGFWVDDSTRTDAEAEYGGAIGVWDVSKVTNMESLFNGGFSTFSTDIDAWDTSAVTTMEDMFKYAFAFNQDLSSWDTGAVTTMEGMFKYARVFDQNLGWCIATTVNTRFAFDESLCKWSSCGVQLDGRASACTTAASTESPTAAPTFAPTASPTAAPTAAPTASPTAAPTAAPTFAPTASPTAAPTESPTAVPTALPTPMPTPAPMPGVKMQSGFVLDGRTLTGRAADFDAAAKEELVVIIVETTDAITDASQITDLEVFDVVAGRRSLLDEGILAEGDVRVSFVVAVEVGAGSNSTATGNALKLSLKTSITSGALDDRLAKSVETILASNGVFAATKVSESVAAIEASTFEEIIIIFGTTATPVPSTAEVPCSSGADCPSGSCVFAGRRALKGGGAFPRVGVCEGAATR